jgi:hypothetical protein
MPFDDLPLFAKVLIAMLGPPIVTIICWLAVSLLAGALSASGLGNEAG